MPDTDRCASRHWSLPAQCVLARAHRENWHEAWHPESGNRIRYRHPGRLTEELRGTEWQRIDTEPSREERLAGVRAEYAGGGVFVYSRTEVGWLLAEIDRLAAELEAKEKDRAYQHDTALRRTARLAAELDQARAERDRYRDAARAEADQLRAQLDTAQAKVHAAGMVRVWRNEDGRRFVFADDLAEALGIRAAAADTEETPK